MIEREVEYPFSPQVVWEALTSRDALAAWLMPNDFEPVVGHQFCFRTDPAPGFDGVVRCEVTELDAPRRMVWTWRGGPIDTVVTWELAESEQGTLLRLRQEGFDGLRGTFTRRILDRGWARMLIDGLPAWLALRSEPPRST